VFALGGFLGAQVEHINQLQVSAWLPWLFWRFEEAAPLTGAPRARRRPIALLGGVIALMLLAGHTQSVYIAMFGLGVYALLRRGLPPRDRRALVARALAVGRDFLPLLAAIGLAALVSAAQLWPTAELARRSIRSGGLDYFDAVAFSLNPFRLYYTLLPPYGVDLEQALGQAFSEFVAYIGLIPLFLAALAVVALRRGRRRSGRVWGLALTGAMGLGLAFGVFTGPVYFLLYRLVPGFNLFRVPARWLLLYAFAAAMLAALGLEQLPRPRLRLLLLALIPAELFFAAQGLRYNRPTAPEAYTSLRPSIVQLLADQSPTDRFLSLSGIVYDPGDLREIHDIFDSQLPPRAVYDYVVAVKEKEVLFFNLPMVYGLNAVDGYDGGLLPLKRFIDLQRLFLPEDNLSLDGRLREKLARVPDARLLSLLGVRHIITDKVFDVWLDDIFYDLQFPARLNPDDRPEVWTTDIPPFPATAIGLVYHTPQRAGRVGQVVVRTASGAETRFDLPAVTSRPWRNAESGLDYNAVFDGLPAGPIAAVGVVADAPLTVRGVSLIHAPSRTSRSLLLTTEGHFRVVHGGDVKIYENLDVLPRAFVVHRAEVVPDVETAIARLKDPAFDVAGGLVRLARPGESPGVVRRGQPHPDDRVTIARYAPERIDLDVTLASPGWLLLTDTCYPGWRVTVDGTPAPLIEADLMFRAVEVPAGTHRLTFAYRPLSVFGGAALSLLGVAGLAILLGGQPRQQMANGD
ncbi:MAG: hypothetical protein D6796_09820, partial [Caldilineae bacterium]